MSGASPAVSDTARSNRRTGVFSALFALAMIGLAYAAVPLYRIFCQKTGFDGTTGVAAAAPSAQRVAAVAGRTIKVRFDANMGNGMGWRFAPKARDVSIRIGEKQMAFYHAVNTSDHAITGQAVYNVSPDVAGQYFIKIACFCFTEQTLKAGEAVDMPVVYYVDPAIMDDPVAKKIDEITLSYTFYPVDKPAVGRLSAATISNSLKDRS